MKNVVVGIMAVAGLASVATATTSIGVLRMQVWDGANWVSNLEVNPLVGGGLVRMRIVADYTGTRTPVAFGSSTFQPTISNWTAGDSINLGQVLGNHTGGADGRYEEGNDFGRRAEFAFPNILTANTLRAHQNTVGGVNFLRIAQRTVTNWVGVGPTGPGPAALNNTNRSGGIPFVQLGTAVPGRPTLPEFIFEVDAIIYGVEIDLADNIEPRVLTIDVPALGRGVARWFNDPTEISPTITGPVDVETATITVIPTPASLALLGLGGLLAARRRR